MKICSCLIPSRNRIGKLLTAIHTLNNSCSNPDNIEILIRLDDDDAVTLKYRATLEGFKNVRVFVGPKKSGYSSVGEFYTELANNAVGKWCWFLLDDCLIGGKDFDLKFLEIPMTGCIVQPGMFRLGGSVYGEVEAGNFPAVPTLSWKGIGHESVGHPADMFLDSIYKKAGWRTKFLPGITAWHMMDQEFQ